MLGTFHAGELGVQSRAGVQAEAQQVGRIIKTTMHTVAQEFMHQQPMAFVTSLDADRRVWASLVAGLPGFMVALDNETVHVGAAPTTGDPLHDNLLVNSDVGLLIVEFATRRRFRVNGRAELQLDGSFYVHAQQVYGNCPKYIQARRYEIIPVPDETRPVVHRYDSLTTKQHQVIKRSDTFFIGSAHPEAGVDSSHRGGNPGFVKAIGSNTLIWPDYFGNNMFNTLGNIETNPRIGLLFLDFDTGSTLQLTGEAHIVWDETEIAKYNGAERLVSFQIEKVIEIENRLPLRWELESYSPFNP